MRYYLPFSTNTKSPNVCASLETARATQILGNAGAVLLIPHDLANQPPLRLAAKRARPWIIGALVFCLLVSGYLAAKPSVDSERVSMPAAQRDSSPKP